MTGEQILIVEDEGLVAEDIRAHLEENGWNVPAVVSSGEDALEKMQATHIDLVLMDIVLTGEKDGIDTAAIIKQKYQTPVIYLTAYADQEKVERARLTDPYGYLVKPFDERELKATVSMTLSKSLNDRAIREGKRWANAVLTSIEDGVITTDLSGRIRDINPAACRILNKSIDHSAGKPLSEIVIFGEIAKQQELETSIARILQAHSSIEIQLQGQLRDSTANTIISAKLSGISYEGKSIDGLVITFHDITLEERARIKLENYNTVLEQRVKERTDEIERALEKAEAANEAKSRFLGNISHELRTPLNPISSYSQLLMMDNSLPSNQKDISAKIYESSQNLLEKIDKLIELSQLATNVLSLNESRFNPVDLVSKIASDFKQQAGDKNIELVTRLPGDFSINVISDVERISNILHHLTDNALKFTEHGKVELGLEVVSEDNSSAVLRFSVEDSGPGIRKEIMRAIFGHFNQADDTLSRMHQGMGVGLTLSKQLIEHMGGIIDVENKPDNGARFWFELPFIKA